MKGSTGGKLTPRREQILRAIIEAYVSSGEPIGSKLLGEQLGVSSATVRNDMASLSELGYIEQPHTSAGRVPSQRGYRKYVDSLMTASAVRPEEQLEIDRALLLDVYEPEGLLKNATKLLAAMSGYAAFSTTPSGADAVIRGVQFVQTGRRTAMAILMASSGAMKHKVFRCDFDLTAEMTRIFFRVLNERLAGKTLQEITPAFVQSLAMSMGPELSTLMLSPIMAVMEMAREALDADICISGQTNLLFCKEFSSGDIRRILSFLESRSELCRLIFEENLPGYTDRVRVLIGRETKRTELSDSSVILARYSVAGKPSGIIGVVGSTRMDYRYMLSRLGYIAESVGRTLEEFMDN